MIKETLHPVTLTFIDPQTEKTFRQKYDEANRIFYRIGIFLSCVAWTIWYSGIYLSYPENFFDALIVLVGALLIPFIAVIILSYFLQFSTVTHNITAYCNFGAACVCIYVATFLVLDITFLCSGIICICFFCYLILRIRFKVAFLITFVYTSLAQISVFISGNFDTSQIITSSSGIWLGFTIAMIAGYFFERTNRKLFIQNTLIQHQREELVDEKDKLKTSIENLKTAQTQLIQSEKMASLGELTAGIAHEIQNPLNFVSNFSSLNKELLLELRVEIDRGNLSEVKDIATNLEQNEEKINHHCKRADNIVKGMLQHTRVSSGNKEPTNINQLADEYLRLSYQGMRAKYTLFNVAIETNFDEAIGHINVVSQDIGRVLLNLYNNAFYSVSKKRELSDGTFEPSVIVSTKKEGNSVLISIEDNGTGIPNKTMNKIFQPFFTTKPPGEGTGLGLSLSYDIVTKGHGGTLSVKSTEEEGAVFVVALPLR